MRIATYNPEIEEFEENQGGKYYWSLDYRKIASQFPEGFSRTLIATLESLDTECPGSRSELFAVIPTSVCRTASAFYHPAFGRHRGLMELRREGNLYLSGVHIHFFEYENIVTSKKLAELSFRNLLDNYARDLNADHREFREALMLIPHSLGEPEYRHGNIVAGNN